MKRLILLVIISGSMLIIDVKADSRIWLIDPIPIPQELEAIEPVVDKLDDVVQDVQQFADNWEPIVVEQIERVENVGSREVIDDLELVEEPVSLIEEVEKIDEIEWIDGIAQTAKLIDNEKLRTVEVIDVSQALSDKESNTNVPISRQEPNRPVAITVYYGYSNGTGTNGTDNQLGHAISLIVGIRHMEFMLNLTHLVTTNYINDFILSNQWSHAPPGQPPKQTLLNLIMDYKS